MRWNKQKGIGLVCAVFFVTLTSVELPAAETNAPPRLRLSLPVDYQVSQRATGTEGTILVAGSLAEAVEYPLILEARLMGAASAADWRKLATVQSGATEFGADLTAPAGGWYRREVRVRQGNTTAGDTTVEHVGVGEVFVVAGQSNAANHGEEKQQTK